jgi:ribosome-dependent ATPase
MHAAKFLAVGPAKELSERCGKDNLGDAFIAYLEDAAGRESGAKPSDTEALPEPTRSAVARASVSSRCDFRRLWAYAGRETMKILRDPIRLGFSFLGPLILMLTVGYGISFDFEHLAYAAFDQDQANESRELLENFSGSRYFGEHNDIASDAEGEQRLKSGQLKIAPRSRRTSARTCWRTSGRKYRCGSMVPCRSAPRRQAAMSRRWRWAIWSIIQPETISRAHGRSRSNVEARFKYNQAFKSVYQTIPSTMMLVLILIPAMTTPVGVAREKETGSIANFRSTPITGIEFLLGK